MVNVSKILIQKSSKLFQNISLWDSEKKLRIVDLCKSDAATSSSLFLNFDEKQLVKPVSWILQ